MFPGDVVQHLTSTFLLAKLPTHFLFDNSYLFGRVEFLAWFLPFRLFPLLFGTLSLRLATVTMLPTVGEERMIFADFPLNLHRFPSVHFSQIF